MNQRHQTCWQIPAAAAIAHVADVDEALECFPLGLPRLRAMLKAGKDSAVSTTRTRPTVTHTHPLIKVMAGDVNQQCPYRGEIARFSRYFHGFLRMHPEFFRRPRVRKAQGLQSLGFGFFQDALITRDH